MFSAEPALIGAFLAGLPIDDKTAEDRIELRSRLEGISRRRLREQEVSQAAFLLAAQDTVMAHAQAPVLDRIVTCPIPSPRS
jgi:hypothetical protein